MADEQEGVRYLLQTRYPQWQNAIEPLEPPLQINALHLIISRRVDDHRQVIAAFNRGLAELTRDGTYSALLQKHRFAANTPLAPPAARAPDVRTNGHGQEPEPAHVRLASEPGPRQTEDVKPNPL